MQDITKKYKFTVGTGYMGSDIEDIVGVDFTQEEYEDECERDRVIENEYIEWRNEQIDGGWEEVE